MTIKRYSTLTFSGTQAVLARPYILKNFPQENSTDCEIFLHIPKCGGTTLHFIMLSGALLRGKSCIRNVITGIDQPVFIRSGWVGAWNAAWEKQLQPQTTPAYYSGHYPFGVHDNITKTCRYITLLRDPVSREISSFNHHYQKGFHNGDISLFERMFDDKEFLDNPQVRMLAGVNSMTGECDEKTYQCAVNNLSKCFSLVGTVEKSGEFIQAMLAMNGWPATVYVRTQITKIKAIESISSQLIEKLYAYHKYDKRLYELVEEKWEGWKQVNVMGESKLDPDDQVIYLPPDIHKSRRPQLITASELRQIL